MRKKEIAERNPDASALGRGRSSGKNDGSGSVQQALWVRRETDTRTFVLGSVLLSGHMWAESHRLQPCIALLLALGLLPALLSFDCVMPGKSLTLILSFPMCKTSLVSLCSHLALILPDSSLLL